MEGVGEQQSVCNTDKTSDITMQERIFEIFLT
jgi:hypothetical protein